jgi:hypothetical protein
VLSDVNPLRNHQVIACKLRNGTLIRFKNAVINLDAVGEFVWWKLDGTNSVDEIAHALCGFHYESIEAARFGVFGLVQILRNANFLQDS